MNKILICLFALLGVAMGNLPMFGFCPDVPPKQDFNTRSLPENGTYKNIYRRRKNFGKCNTKIFTDLKTLFMVIKKDTDITTNDTNMLFGFTLFHNGPNIANMLWYFPPPDMLIPHEVKIIATDYTNYAILYYCVPIGILHYRHAQILTRARYPSAAVMSAAYLEFNKAGFDQQSLIKNDHVNCSVFH